MRRAPASPPRWSLTSLAYGNGDFETSNIQQYVDRATQAGKKLLFQEWGVCYRQTDKNQNCDSGDPDGNRASNIAKWAQQIQAAGVPWLYWYVARSQPSPSR